MKGDRGRVGVFEVNETLLDLAALDPHVDRVFGNRAARKEWFSEVRPSALVAAVTDGYADFTAIG